MMLRTLEEIHLPQPFVDIITDVYKGSFLQVICGDQLTEPVPLQVGIKTGCPWSAVNFILAINQWLKWLCQCAPPQIRSPNPVQGYADDVEMSSRDESVITNMLGRTDFLLWSKLEVKHTKCAALYERRSGGNRWYKAKSDKSPSFTLMGQPIRVYSRHKTYTYLGHKFNIAGEWGEQIQKLSCDCKYRIDLIDSSPLPLVMKLEAIREVALAKIQHLFANVHIPQNVLQVMNNKTVEAVRRWLGVNTHSSRDILFLSHKEGGLGVPNVEWTYTTTRLTHLIRMLNNDDAAVRDRTSMTCATERQFDWNGRKEIHTLHQMHLMQLSQTQLSMWRLLSTTMGHNKHSTTQSKSPSWTLNRQRQNNTELDWDCRESWHALTLLTTLSLIQCTGMPL